MKKMKIGLGAIAFAVALSGAIVTYAADNDLDLCSSNPNPPSTAECPTGTQVDCCYTFNPDGSQKIWKRRAQ